MMQRADRLYEGTTNSSLETRARAINLAKAIGAYHTDTVSKVNDIRFGSY